ncbi:hypothetical protein CEXT_137011 [Caerostris extrusa]|uniref:Uncharacterized protein n=1 Tax=Caerostris extrusa TaxID=172846 RepID=A0AAV4NZV5_CAEEX|nr:hypothetical protein CEXT_137011 [Caerostris extrusa]
MELEFLFEERKERNEMKRNNRKSLEEICGCCWRCVNSGCGRGTCLKHVILLLPSLSPSPNLSRFHKSPLSYFFSFFLLHSLPIRIAIRIDKEGDCGK